MFVLQIILLSYFLKFGWITKMCPVCLESQNFIGLVENTEQPTFFVPSPYEYMVPRPRLHRIQRRIKAVSVFILYPGR